MKGLPSFINLEGSDKEVLRLPSQYHLSPNVMDTVNIQTLMSTPIKVTLTLVEILKVKLELWQEVTTCLDKMGVPAPEFKPIWMPREVVGKVKCETIPINKVGDYCEGGNSNTTLLVEFNEVKSMAILDSGTGVAIATKSVWDAWGNPALRKIRMKLQLTDRYIEYPIGLLEKVIVTSCGIEYEHTFAMVDFGKNPNYEIILGCPFMQQLKIIQD